MARKFPKTIHTILEKLDLEHTLYLHFILQKHTTLFDESCSLWYDMFSEDYELDEESGMWQWYTDRLRQQQLS